MGACHHACHHIQIIQQHVIWQGLDSLTIDYTAIHGIVRMVRADEKLSVVPTADGDLPVSWETLKDRLEELAGPEPIHEGAFTVPVTIKHLFVEEGDELRIKIRLAGATYLA